MEQRERLIEILSKYFTIGDSDEYSCIRDKSAFAIGTMSLEDFVEFDDEKVADIADHLIANGVVVLPESTSAVKWHEVKTRPLDDDEKEYYADMDMELEFIFDCEMPEDGQEILIATKWGTYKDICSNDADYGIELEGHGDWDGVYAWAEMPTYAKRKGGDE